MDDNDLFTPAEFAIAFVDKFDSTPSKTPEPSQRKLLVVVVSSASNGI